MHRIGTSVYMAAASTDKSGGYVVSVDNQAVSSIDAFAGTSAAPSCGFAVRYLTYVMTFRIAHWIWSSGHLSICQILHILWLSI